MGKNTEPSTFTSSVVLTGTALEGTFAPPIGHVDIGISESAYLFRVALPGVRKEKTIIGISESAYLFRAALPNVRKEKSELNCEVERDGKVHIQGVLTSGELAKKNPGHNYAMNMMQLSPPGPFSLSFKLPGEVDPRLFSATFRSDGILEGVVMKSRVSPGEPSETAAL